ncbi:MULTISPECIES: DNA polymerase III subunit beta [Cetobacterium]|uniref:Beta sliding clamp n=1 Tax=Candidatus Cetobacterium colombiensis TaxID=3073100 RepID=A0ABU4W8Y7_9FUSO|nr:DNA polymerase III subunit beta [Candidatus Cetobacterium colombiensis]MDX8335512.1 DNA polymerase III subunit beta [Candidatus Cetobacterium colombiensis]
MILKVNRLEFLKKIKIVEKAINENKIRPIISYVYIETRENKLWFCGTNLELTISTHMECEILREGKAVFQHNLVEEYLKEIKDEEITLNINEDVLTIETSDSASEFILMNAEEFPKIQEPDLNEEEFEFKLKKLDLADYFDKVKFSASMSSDNLSINCIRMEIENNKIKFISTDTYRLTYLEHEYSHSDEMFKVSIPINTIDAMSKLLRNGNEDEIAFTQKNKQLYFKLGNISIISRVIDLPFPNYKTILEASGYNKKLQINRVEFEKMLKRIQIFVKNNAESKFGAIFTLSGDNIDIEGIGEIAKAKEIAKVNYEGDNLKISLNVKFLLEFIQSSDKDIITLEFTTSNSAVRTRNIQEDNYTYIVMPLALKD